MIRDAGRTCGTPLAAALLVLLVAGRAFAGLDELGTRWQEEFWGNVTEPWFIFGMGAQGLFFLRFIVQWIVSERRRRSTIPIAFWYISLAGGLAMFIYAVHEAQPVFMLGQLLACVIYVRNLMLIYRRRERFRRTGLPMEEPSATDNGDDVAANGP